MHANNALQLELYYVRTKTYYIERSSPPCSQSARLLLLQLLLRLLLADARLAVSAHSHRQQQLLC